MDDGTWELIDGLQRLSSIFEFMGILRDPDTKELVVPSALISTRYLKALNNAVWQKNAAIIDPKESDQIELDKKFQLSIRRSRLNVQVLKRPSDSLTKFELFQRLNAGGTQANAQELRNSIVIMLDRDFSVMMRELAEHPSFAEVIEVSADAKEKQKDMEYVSRFIVYTYVKYDGTLDIEEFIDEGLMETIKSNKMKTIKRDFLDTFDFLFEACGPDALRRFDGKKFGGRVGYTAFELIAVGVAQNIKAIRANPKRKEFIASKIKKLWDEKIPEELVYGGMRGTTRISRTLPNGADWFK